MEYHGEKLLIIGAGPLQAPAITRARRMGLTVLATDMDPAAPGFRHAHGHAVISTLDAPATVAYVKKEKVRGVMTLATDMPLGTVAAVADALGLCAVSPQTADLATNKFKMKRKLAAAGVACPTFEIAVTLEQAVAAAERIGWPVVTKPLYGSGSRGVALCGSPAELEAALAPARQVAKKKQVVIEEYARGRHLCVEAFTWKGRTRIICAIDRVVSRPPRFVELRHTFPSALGRKRHDAACDAVLAGIEALGIEMGPSHTDMIVTERGPLISEIGARLDGDYKSSHFMPLVYGYDIIADTIRAAMGDEPMLFAKGGAALAAKTALCIHYFTPKPGKVNRISGAVGAKRMPGVKYLDLWLKPGSEIVPFSRSHDRVGVVIATGTTAREAAAAAKGAEKQIRVEYLKT